MVGAEEAFSGIQDGELGYHDCVICEEEVSVCELRHCHGLAAFDSSDDVAARRLGLIQVSLQASEVGHRLAASPYDDALRIEKGQLLF